jgi:HK97 family phage portal protein
MADHPGLIDRLKLALRVYRRGIPGRAWQSSSAKASLPFLWPSWREQQPQWQIIDYQSYVDEGFNLNALIYQAIMYKVRAIAAAPLRAFQGDPDQPELLKPEHPLSQLVARPNAYQSGVEFCQLCTIHLNIAGNVFIFIERAKGGQITSMKTLRPDRVFIVPGDGGLKGYLYTPEGKTPSGGINPDGVIPILPEDMMHVKLPNPLDPLEGYGYGLSPMSALARSGDVDNAITHFLKLFFQNGAMPSTAVSYDVPLDSDQISQIKDKWQEIYGGYENWSDIAVLPQGGKVQRIGLTFDEMGFQGLDERNENRITGPFGVPTILLNTRTGSIANTFANYASARSAFWQDTFVPEIGLYDAEYMYYLRSEDGGFVQHGLSKVPALQQDKPALVEAVFKLWSMGAPLNIASQALGLELPEVPGGDIGYLPLSIIPVTSAAPKPKPNAAGAAEVGDNIGKSQIEDSPRRTRMGERIPAVRHKTSQWTPEQKVNLWKAADRVAQSWEKRFAEGAVASFEADKRAILGIIGGARAKALERKATIEWEELNTDVKAYLEAEGAEAWRSKFVPLMRGVITDQAKRLTADFGIQFDVRNLLAEDWFNEYTLKFSQPINATTLDGVGALLQQAQTEGWSIPAMQKRLSSVFEQWSQGDLAPEDFEWYQERMPGYRTEMIARTETMRASNAGSHELFKQAGIEKQEWLSTQDDRTRDDHLAADGQVRTMDNPFDVGGEELIYPGDPAGSPENTVNCRCTLLPVVKE